MQTAVVKTRQNSNVALFDVNMESVVRGHRMRYSTHTAKVTRQKTWRQGSLGPIKSIYTGKGSLNDQQQLPD